MFKWLTGSVRLPVRTAVGAALLLGLLLGAVLEPARLAALVALALKSFGL